MPPLENAESLVEETTFPLTFAASWLPDRSISSVCHVAVSYANVPVPKLVNVPFTFLPNTHVLPSLRISE